MVVFNEMKHTKGGTGFSGVDKEFRFYHVTFEVLIRYPNDSVKAIGYINVRARRQVQAGDIKLELIYR